MKILIYNIKGGQGKTSLALNLALTLDYGVITNELYSPIETVLPENSFVKIDKSEKLPPVENDWDIIYDFGGYLDLRVIDALEMCDCVIVPVVNEFLDVHTTVNFIHELKEYNPNIIIVANKTEKGDFDNICKIMKIHHPQHPVLEIKKSRALPNILNEKISIRDMVKQGGLKKYNYSSINDQFTALIKEIKQHG